MSELIVPPTLAALSKTHTALSGPRGRGPLRDDEDLPGPGAGQFAGLTPAVSAQLRVRGIERTTSFVALEPFLIRCDSSNTTRS